MALLVPPFSYSNRPTSLALNSLMGATSDTAVKTAQQLAPNSAIASSVQGCRVGSDEAAFYGFAQGNLTYLVVLVLHRGFLYTAEVRGAGGIDQRVVGDTKSLLGSLSWVSPSPHDFSRSFSLHLDGNGPARDYFAVQIAANGGVLDYFCGPLNPCLGGNDYQFWESGPSAGWQQGVTPFDYVRVRVNGDGSLQILPFGPGQVAWGQDFNIKGNFIY
jgi:hypothetical protein